MEVFYLGLLDPYLKIGLNANPLLQAPNIRPIFDVHYRNQPNNYRMVKTLLLSLLFTLPLLTYAQSRIDALPVGDTHQSGRVPTLQKSVVDTLQTPALSLPCFTGSITSFFVPDTGYLVGSNIFGDFLQLQRVVNPNSSSFEVLSVEAPFVITDSSLFDLYVSAIVFSEVDADGVPESLLGRSDSLRIGDFNRDTLGGMVGFTNFTFSDPITVTNDSFLIGFDFSNTFTETEVKFLGLYSTIPGCGDGNNLVQGSITNDGAVVFGTFAQYYGGTNLEIPLYVAVEDIVSSTGNTTRAEYELTAFPNPAQNWARLIYQASTTGTYTATLSDLTGRPVRSSQNNLSSGSQQIEWDIRDLPSGLYLYHIDGPKGRQSGKLMKR